MFCTIFNFQTRSRIIDEEGVIRLQKNDAKIMVMKKRQLSTRFEEFVDSLTQFSDAGAILPKTYLFFGQKMSDLSGVVNKEQLLGLADMELEFVEDNQELLWYQQEISEYEKV